MMLSRVSRGSSIGIGSTSVTSSPAEAMTPFFTESFGNPASRHHSLGCDAAKTVEKAREQIASVIGADPREIFFTSGATECNNIAVKGVMHFYRDRRRHGRCGGPNVGCQVRDGVIHLVSHAGHHRHR